MQWADEQTIAAVERNGGKITVAYYDLHSVCALSAPLKFLRSGVPIPRRLTPPGNLLHMYIDPAKRGYLADPARVAEEREVLAQKYGYEAPNYDDNPELFEKNKVCFYIYKNFTISLNIFCLCEKMYNLEINVSEALHLQKKSLSSHFNVA